MKIRWLPLAALLLLASAPARPAAGDGLAVTRVLLERLRAHGRAEAKVRVVRRLALDDRPRTLTGTLVLERPHFARLDLSTGEKLALREDGGDWLQPRARQLVHAGPRSSGGALMWWGVFLEGGGARFDERAEGARRFVLTPRDSSGPEQHVTLGADRLPARVEITTDAGERSTWTLGPWRFARPRGRAAFTLKAPAGYEVVDMP